jgi:putative membrane protein
MAGEASRPAGEAAWQRVHPLTPALRSWQVIAVLLVVIAQELGQNALGTEGERRSRVPDPGGWILAGSGLALAVLVSVIGVSAYLSWRFTRYRVTGEALELQHGVVFRQFRQAPLDRLQAVDIVQPVLARIVGLARLTLEVAGGPDSRIELAYLTETQARQLRNHLLASAAGIRYDTPEAPEAPEHFDVAIPPQRIVGSVALSGVTVWLVIIAVGFAGAAAVSGMSSLIVGSLPMVLGTGGVLWQRFTSRFGFRVATAPDGLRLRHGLLEHRTQTVPPGRVQAVKIHQPLLWRPRRWWAVEVNVAGYGMQLDGSGTSSTVLLPVGTRDEAVAVLSFVLPDLGVAGESPGAVVDAGLSGAGPDGGFTSAPRKARWVDPLGWRRQAFRVTSKALLLRRGVVHRELTIVPHARTQSCGVKQGPLQRQLGLASFMLHSTPGPVFPQVHHLASDVAAALLTEQVVRARQARAASGPERWMERPGPAPSAPMTAPDRPDPSDTLQEPPERPE